MWNEFASPESLNLSKQKLETFPEDITIPNNTIYLNLFRNRLKNFPRDLGHMKGISLRENHLGELSNDELETFMNNITSYKSLKSLDLSKNMFKAYKFDFTPLKHLKKLGLSLNELDNNSDSGDSFEIKCDSNLEVLDLSMNKFTKFPDKIPSNIVYLNLENNCIHELNANVPNIKKICLTMNGLNLVSDKSKFTALTTLDISRNNLSKLPDLTKVAPNIIEFNGECNFFVEVPSLPPSVKNINLHKNNIHKLPENLALLYPKLKVLDISKNNFETLPDFPPSIKEITGNQNKISSINPCELPKLRKLFLGYNFLTSLPPYKAPLLNEIYLNNNLITEIDTSYISSSLKYAFFQNNYISEISDSFFQRCSPILLNFSNNRIRFISNLISDANELTTLCLTMNPIREIMIPRIPSSLETIYIGNCDISHTQEKKLFSSFLTQNIEEIYLSGNSLKSLPDNLNKYSKLKKLRASRNQITLFPKTLPESLTVLDLSYNKIQTLPEKVSNFPNLVDFNISYNELKKIPNYISKICTNLKYFNFSFNSIDSNESIDLSRLNNLAILEIENFFGSIKYPDCVHQIIASESAKLELNQKVNIFYRHQSVGASEMNGCRENMEDSLLVHYHFKEISKKDSPEEKIILSGYGVFDGHGGDSASKFSSFYFNEKLSLNGCLNQKFFQAYFDSLCSKLKKNKITGGSTAAVVIIGDNKLISAHIGDSRVLVIGDGTTFQTLDHKPEMRGEQDRIQSEGGRIAYGRVNATYAVSRSIGDFGVIGLGRKPDIITHHILPTDKWLIIACDGLFDVLDTDTIIRIASNAKNTTELSLDLRNAAYGLMSMDNISVIVIDLKLHNSI